MPPTAANNPSPLRGNGNHFAVKPGGGNFIVQLDKVAHAALHLEKPEHEQPFKLIHHAFGCTPENKTGVILAIVAIFCLAGIIQIVDSFIFHFHTILD